MGSLRLWRRFHRIKDIAFIKINSQMNRLDGIISEKVSIDTGQGEL